LVFTSITLQHLPPDAIRRYLEEFLRVAKPGGCVIFQLPSHLSEKYLPAERSEEPLPPAACQADVTLVVPLDPFVPAATHLEVTVDVTNKSGVCWVQNLAHPLNVGNHWVSGADGEVTNDDGRSRLPGRVNPGEVVRVTLPVQVPAQRGVYSLQIDVVQEGVAWFATCGSKTAAAALEVIDPAMDKDDKPAVGYDRGTLAGLISPNFFDAPSFSMNGMPKPEVEKLLRAYSATLLGVDEWVDEWNSYTYYVSMPLR
jgi:hypothetical protein